MSIFADPVLSDGIAIKPFLGEIFAVRISIEHTLDLGPYTRGAGDSRPGADGGGPRHHGLQPQTSSDPTGPSMPIPSSATVSNTRSGPEDRVTTTFSACACLMALVSAS